MGKRKNKAVKELSEAESDDSIEVQPLEAFAAGEPLFLLALDNLYEEYCFP